MIPMHPIQGLGCYTGLPHPRAQRTCLFVHDDFGNLVWQKDRTKAYNSSLPNGFPPASVAHPLDVV